MEARTTHSHEAPPACSLDAAGVEERRRRWRALVESSLLEQEATANGVRQRYRADREVERELRELAEAERDCCSFASWEVRASQGFVELEVSSAGEGAAVVREMFRA